MSDDLFPVALPPSEALAEFRKWVRKAPAGRDFVYHISGEELPDDLFPGVRASYEDGKIALFQTRSLDGQGGCLYHARKLSPSSRDFVAECERNADKVSRRLAPSFRPSGTPNIGRPTSHINPTLED